MVRKDVGTGAERGCGESYDMGAVGGEGACCDGVEEALVAKNYGVRLFGLKVAEGVELRVTDYRYLHRRALRGRLPVLQAAVRSPFAAVCWSSEPPSARLSPPSAGPRSRRWERSAPAAASRPGRV